MVDRFVSTPSPLKGGCPLMNAAVDADDGNLQLRRLAQQSMQRWKSRLLKILREGMERGEIARGVDPIRVTNTIIAVLEGSLLISRIEGSSRPLQDARSSLAMVIDGIEARDKRTARAK